MMPKREDSKGNPHKSGKDMLVLESEGLGKGRPGKKAFQTETMACGNVQRYRDAVAQTIASVLYKN